MGYRMLQHIPFLEPALSIVLCHQERWDGSGVPQGRKGEQILLPARVVAVANAFVGMISPRAHRKGLDFDAAIETLRNETGSAYDARVVSALINYLDNRGGRKSWKDFHTQSPAA